MAEELVLNLSKVEVPGEARELISAGLTRSLSIDWFDFVASDCEVVYTLLSALQRGAFCEWGSGLGIVTGLAEMLGYDAKGIEIHEPLANASRELLHQFGLRAEIEIGDVFERHDAADLYFTYFWPGKVPEAEAHFRAIAPAGSRLLIYYGPSDIRWIQNGEKLRNLFEEH